MSTRFNWLTVITGLFITTLLVSNIIAVKLISVFGLILPAAVILFPLSYICGDVLTEVYGYSVARRVIWLGFACNLVAVLAIWLGQIMPAASFWNAEEAYAQILGSTPRLLVASFAAYLVGEFANSMILAKLKVATNGRFLWLRTMSSTLIGEGLDSVVFISVAFAGIIPSPALMSAMVTQWLFKTAYEFLATPLTYITVNFLKRVERLDVFDKSTSLNPIRLTE